MRVKRGQSHVRLFKNQNFSQINSNLQWVWLFGALCTHITLCLLIQFGQRLQATDIPLKLSMAVEVPGRFWFLVGFQGSLCSSLLWLQSWGRQQDRSVGFGPDLTRWHWACDGSQKASRYVGSVWAGSTLLCCNGRHLLLLHFCPYQVKGQRDRLGGRRAAGHEKVALGWWRHLTLRWEPAARNKKVLNWRRGGYTELEKSRSVQLVGVREMLNLLVERAVASSGRLSRAGLILRMAENKWPGQRKSEGEKTTGDGKTKEVAGGEGRRLKWHVWNREQFGYEKRKSNELIGKDRKKKYKTVAVFHSDFQWLQEDRGVSPPASSTGYTSKPSDTPGTNSSLPAGCTSAWCNLFQCVCPDTNNLISTNILYCSLISLPVSFMLMQYTTPPRQQHLNFKYVLA